MVQTTRQISTKHFGQIEDTHTDKADCLADSKQPVDKQVDNQGGVNT